MNTQIYRQNLNTVSASYFRKGTRHTFANGVKLRVDTRVYTSNVFSTTKILILLSFCCRILFPFCVQNSCMVLI